MKVIASLILLLIAAARSPGNMLEPMQGEKHLAGIRQLSFGGENAEAYFSFDEQKLVFQSTRPRTIATRSSR